ncbi:hypothetical protein [Desulfobacca acetoxidans]|nr:hypothetical protein [Desulfobacterales bacterium]
MSNWFYDDIPVEYRDLRKFMQPIENEYLELRQLLAQTEKEIKTQGTDAELEARAAYLRKRIEALEVKHPWLVSGLLLEHALWGMPH